MERWTNNYLISSIRWTKTYENQDLLSYLYNFCPNASQIFVKSKDFPWRQCGSHRDSFPTKDLYGQTNQKIIVPVAESQRPHGQAIQNPLLVCQNIQVFFFFLVYKKKTSCTNISLLYDNECGFVVRYGQNYPGVHRLILSPLCLKFTNFWLILFWFIS